MIHVYTDTSVIGGCFDKEFKEHSLALFEEFKTGAKKLILSDLVKMELELANEQVNKKPDEVPGRFKVEIKSTVKASSLAATYIWILRPIVYHSFQSKVYQRFQSKVYHF